MNNILCLIVAAVTWFPADDWQDMPDPVASPNARKGGTLRFNGDQAPKSYNAYIDNNSYTRMTFDLMYENLLTTDPKTLDFQPGLARRWAVSDDGREFTFVIDDRARWSDGKPVDECYDVENDEHGQHHHRTGVERIPYRAAVATCQSVEYHHHHNHREYSD